MCCADLSHKFYKMELTKEQKQEWQNWLDERPENVRRSGIPDTKTS